MRSARRLSLLVAALLLCLLSAGTAQQGGSSIPGLSDVVPGAGGQDQQKKQKDGAQAQQERSYPGVAEVVPRLAELNEQSSAIEQRLGSLGDVSGIRETIKQARQRQQLIDDRLDKRPGPAGWNLNRQRENRRLLQQQQDQIASILEDLSSPLSEMDGIARRWSDKREFWKGWRSHLGQDEMQISGEPFSKALQTIDSVLASTREAMQPLLGLQGQVTELQARNNRTLNRIEALLESEREEIFSRTALPFFSPQYYRQFGADLWEAVDEGVEDVRWLSSDFLAQQSWILLLQALVAAFVPILIKRYRGEAQQAEEWQFVLDHPWATGIFVAITSLGFLYSYPPALAQLFFWTLAAISASVLIAALLHNPRKIFMVYLLAVLFILTLLLNTIALPLPIYRLYIMLLSLLGAPVLWMLSNRNRAANDGSLDIFGISLRIGSVVLVATFVAQFWGYSALAMRIVEASIETVFLVLFAVMAMRVGSGGIEFALRRPFLRRSRFFRRYGSGLSDRLKGLFRFVLSAYAFLYLLTVWNLFATVSQAWAFLGEVGFDLGQARISLKMLLLAGFVLYLSIFASWVLQAALDTGVLSRRKVDRGVRDSIKKLLHYSLVLIGFSFALKLAGFALENFVVLAGAFGIGIGFGLQNIVNNFISGIILLFERPVKVDDMVVVDEEWGRVRKIGLRSTIVETLDQAEIIVPNSMFISEKVTNWSLTTTVVRLVIPVGVAYGSDVEKVLRVLEEVCKDHRGVLEDPAPSPIFVSFGESSLDFELRAWLSDVNARLQIRSDLCQAIDRRFREEGITIPFPQRDLHLRSMEGGFAESVRSLRSQDGEGKQ